MANSMAMIIGRFYTIFNCYVNQDSGRKDHKIIIQIEEKKSIYVYFLMDRGLFVISGQ